MQIQIIKFYCVVAAITKMHELQSGKIPEGYVRFKTNDRVNRICLWINQVSFLNVYIADYILYLKQNY